VTEYASDLSDRFRGIVTRARRVDAVPYLGALYTWSFIDLLNQHKVSLVVLIDPVYEKPDEDR